MFFSHHPTLLVLAVISTIGAANGDVYNSNGYNSGLDWFNNCKLVSKPANFLHIYVCVLHVCVCARCVHAVCVRCVYAYVLVRQKQNNSNAKFYKQHVILSSCLEERKRMRVLCTRVLCVLCGQSTRVLVF